jgi:hypothetical protein
VIVNRRILVWHLAELSGVVALIAELFQDLAHEFLEIQHCENGDDARTIGLKLWELALCCRRGQINVVALYEPLPSNQPNQTEEIRK